MAFDPSTMPVTPRYGIRYPGGNNLVKYASQQFKAMAESIDDNIDTLPDKVTQRVNQAAADASAAAERAEQAAATAGTQADQNIAANINNAGSYTSLALDKRLNKGMRWHNAVIIGDSLCKGYYDGAEHAGQGIGDFICLILGITQVQNMAVSGSGFTVGGGNNFYGQWTRVQNKQNVDLVLVIGGVNDGNVDCENAVIQLLSSIQQDAPNARTYVFPVAGGLGLGLYDHYAALHTINCGVLTSTGDVNKNVVLMQGCHRWGQMIATNETDGTIHMNLGGYSKWARIAAKLIKEGCNTFWPCYARDLNVINPSSGDPVFDQVKMARFIECNGTITLQIIAHTQRPIDTNYILFRPDPYLCSDTETKYFACNINAGSYLTVEDRGFTMQISQFPTDQWIFINTSWIAGM